MSESTAFTEFKQGARMLRDSAQATALEHFRAAAELEKKQSLLRLIFGSFVGPRGAEMGARTEAVRIGAEHETQ